MAVFLRTAFLEYTPVIFIIAYLSEGGRVNAKCKNVHLQNNRTLNLTLMIRRNLEKSH